ncbi:MAG TPA: ABC transporter permease [Verrucomicrobiae bacterium]|nr:ABC transporter permease [Verrucomicrobiae bacterium]
MLHDLQFAFRQLLKSPGFSLVAMLTLALAIGANTAIFSAIDAVLLHPLPYPDPNQLVIVQETLPRYSLHGIAPTAPDYAEFRRQATCFSQIAAVTDAVATLTGDGQPEDVPALRVTASAFPMLGVVPVVGGLFTSDDDQPGRDHVAILSEGLWTRRYGRDPSIVGKNIQINLESYRVAGVIRPILDYRVAANIWMPLAFAPAETAPGTRSPHYIDVIGRLKPGGTIQEARDEFHRIAAFIVEQYPNQASMDRGFSLDLKPLAEKQAGDLKTPLLVLIAAVGALMLIACANVSNLLLARALKRRREIGIRSALGASRLRVIRQLLTESLLLAFIAGAAGTLLALYGLRLYAQFGPADLIHGARPSINAWVMGFSLFVSIAASMLFGIAPALETSRIDLTEALKEGSRGSTVGHRLLRESMVAFEVCASLVLLIGAGLLVRSFVRLEHTSPGFQPEKVLTAFVSLPVAQYREASQRAAFAQSVLERVRAIPGVRSAATIDFLPYNGGPGSGGVEIVGHPRNPNEPQQIIWQTRASPGFFETLGIPLLRGRDISASDEQGSPGAAVIDEITAEKLFSNADPIGMQITVPLAGSTFTVVGVVAATKSRSLSAPPEPRIYYFGPQVPFGSLAIVMKTVYDPLAVASGVRHELAALDSNLPVDLLTMDQILADSLARQRFSIQLMAVFAALAGLLAAIGIYGVLAYLVDQQRREFGIRIALGARSADVLALVLRQGLVPLAAGLITGIAGAFALTRLLKTLLYEVSATDPLIFAAVSVGLVAVSLAAMFIPALRATRVSPLDALRHE